MLKVSKTF